MTIYVDHVFICLFAVYVSSLMSCLLRSLAHFKFFIFLLLSLKDSLYILDNSTLWLCLLQIFLFYFKMMDFPGSSAAKESACNVGDLSSIPGLEDPLYSPWGSQRVGHDWVTFIFFSRWCWVSTCFNVPFITHFKFGRQVLM